MPALNDSKIVHRASKDPRTAADMSSRERNNTKNQAAASHPPRRSRFLRFILLCLALVGLFMVKDTGFISQNFHSKGDIEVKLLSTSTLPLHPKNDTSRGRQHFYMLPPENATKDGRPKGVLVYLHSCQQSGLDFFTLPEHRIIANEALQKGLVVFSPTSRNRESGCYTSEDSNGSLGKIFARFLRTHRLSQLPRVGLGDSSGGAFLNFVHGHLKLDSMAVYNSPGEIHRNETASIPTVYLTMSTDTPIADRMEVNKERLQNMSIPSYLYKVHPTPFTKELCAARLPEIPEGVCEHIFQTIKNDHSKLIGSDGFVLEGDVKSSHWKRCFKRLESDYKVLSPTVVADAQSLYKQNENWTLSEKRSWLWIILEEEIKACYGFHAMTSRFHKKIIDFLISNSKMEG